MGWGEKAIEIRSVETGHLDGVFMHKRAQRLKFLCERNDKVRLPYSSCPLAAAAYGGLWSMAVMAHSKIKKPLNILFGHIWGWAPGGGERLLTVPSCVAGVLCLCPLWWQQPGLFHDLRQDFSSELVEAV